MQILSLGYIIELVVLTLFETGAGLTKFDCLHLSEVDDYLRYTDTKQTLMVKFCCSLSECQKSLECNNGKVMRSVNISSYWLA